MADKTIGSLPNAASLTDDSSFVCEDSGVAKRVTGKQFKDFAKSGAVEAQLASEEAANKALASEEAAQGAAIAAAGSKELADNAATLANSYLKDTKEIFNGSPANPHNFEVAAGQSEIYVGIDAADQYVENEMTYRLTVNGESIDVIASEETISGLGVTIVGDGTSGFTVTNQNGYDVTGKYEIMAGGVRYYSVKSQTSASISTDASALAVSSKAAAAQSERNAKNSASNASTSETNAKSAADRAEVALTKTPKIQNGTWWVFDASSQVYVDTGVKAQGEQGIPGEKGETGEPGKDGYTPVKGVDYFDGEPGEKGDPFRYEDFTPEQLDDLERGAKAAQSAAETAAASAATSARQASVSEQNAAGSASTAQQSASNAAESATAAAQSAASIGNVEQVVTQKAEEASTSAANAAASAEAAARSAEQAAEVVGGNFATKSEAQGYANTAESNAKSYTDKKIAVIPTPDVSGQIGSHNTNTEAHNDIRKLITGLTNRLNALADSDDTTLDQLSEIVAYIKNNKTLIEGITTSKVNVNDIINNLATNATNKPLSAAQGVVLKELIDAITVPTKVSELENDSGYLTSYTETDPTVPSWAKAQTKPTYTASEVGALPYTTPIPTALSDLSEDTAHRVVTDEEKTAWNAKADAPKSVSVTLASASWDSTAKTQTVTVTGVSATETAQMVTPTPAMASQTAYYEAGILCTGQAADSLTFTCTTAPTEDLTVYVVIQEVTHR